MANRPKSNPLPLLKTNVGVPNWVAAFRSMVGVTVWAATTLAGGDVEAEVVVEIGRVDEVVVVSMATEELLIVVEFEGLDDFVTPFMDDVLPLVLPGVLGRTTEWALKVLAAAETSWLAGSGFEGANFELAGLVPFGAIFWAIAIWVLTGLKAELIPLNGFGGKLPVRTEVVVAGAAAAEVLFPTFRFIFLVLIVTFLILKVLGLGCKTARFGNVGKAGNWDEAGGKFWAAADADADADVPFWTAVDLGFWTDFEAPSVVPFVMPLVLVPVLIPMPIFTADWDLAFPLLPFAALTIGFPLGKTGAVVGKGVEFELGNPFAVKGNGAETGCFGEFIALVIFVAVAWLLELLEEEVGWFPLVVPGFVLIPMEMLVGPLFGGLVPLEATLLELGEELFNMIPSNRPPFNLFLFVSK